MVEAEKQKKKERKMMTETLQQKEKEHLGCCCGPQAMTVQVWSKPVHEDVHEDEKAQAHQT